MENVKDKVIAITGASSGIGRATALMLAEAGARLVLGARRAERLETLAGEIEAAGGTAIAHETDVTDRASVQGLVDRATETLGRLDVFIGNAGVGPISGLDDLRVADWEAMVDVNFKGALYGIAATLPVFRRQSSGHFISVISVAGLSVAPGMAVYAATKNAVRTLHEGLRQEAGPNLRVTGISPGYVRTEFGDAIPDEKLREQVASGMDMAISPDAIARSILFAIAQPADVDIGDIVIRPTAQG